MKVVVQRVTSASVTVDSNVVSTIGRGMSILAGIGPYDTTKDVDTLANKLVKLRLWPDEKSQWKKDVKDIDGEFLCVSQFTLFGSVKKGNKPDFHGAAPGDKARQLYDYFLFRIGELYRKERVKDGVFGAMMQVALVNDGPVTLQLDTNPAKPEEPLEPKQAPISQAPTVEETISDLIEPKS